MKLSWGILSRRAFVSLILIFATLVATIDAGRASAIGQITSRSLTLVAGGGGDGGSKIGGVVNHAFTFSIPSTTTVGSIQFQYCTTASVAACVMPSGMVTTSLTIGSQTGVMTGFTVNGTTLTTNGSPYLTRTAAAPSAGVENIQLNGVTNPTVTAQTFYVRISTFATTNATGAATDQGSVAAATTNQIVLTGTMPESLVFCAGGTVGTTGGVPDCTTATSGAVTFNQLFSPTDTATVTSQMAASTNANSGYIITVNGVTLTSGGNPIPAMTTTGSGDLGVRGTGQFGLNLKLNTTLTSTVAVGAEVSAASNGTSLRGQALTGYASVDHFRFVTGDSVANSANGGAGPTNSQIYTVSYIVNVAGNQPSGTYTSTLTYICTGYY